MVLQQMEKWDEVVKACDKVLDLIPQKLGEKITSLDLGVKDKIDTPEEFESAIWASKGNALGLLARVSEASSCFDKAIELDPKNMAVWFGKAGAKSQLGRHEEAATCYDRVLEVNPEDWVSLNEKDRSIDC